MHEEIERMSVKKQKTQQTLSQFFDQRVNIKISYSDILLSALKFITVDGRPLDIVNDSSFQFIRNLVALLPDKKAPINEKKYDDYWLMQLQH